MPARSGTFARQVPGSMRTARRPARGGTRRPRRTRSGLFRARRACSSRPGSFMPGQLQRAAGSAPDHSLSVPLNLADSPMICLPASSSPSVCDDSRRKMIERDAPGGEPHQQIGFPAASLPAVEQDIRLRQIGLRLRPRQRDEAHGFRLLHRRVDDALALVRRQGLQAVQNVIEQRQVTRSPRA
jgi:hypothetical protein